MTRTNAGGWKRMNCHGINSINMPSESVRPPGPTKWEQLMREYCLDESAVLCILQSRGKQALELRQWIKTHRDAVYIPEPVLETLDIRTRWN